MEAPNAAALTTRLRRLGMDERGVERVFQTFNAYAPAFRQAVGGG
jgi:hypothetical protein